MTAGSGEREPCCVFPRFLIGGHAIFPRTFFHHVEDSERTLLASRYTYVVVGAYYTFIRLRMRCFIRVVYVPCTRTTCAANLLGTKTALQSTKTGEPSKKKSEIKAEIRN